jgi:hypothetical protein
MSTPKKPFVLRLNAEMMAALEKWASDEFRSTNGQLEYLLHEALKKAGRLPGKGKDQKGQKDQGTP